MKRLFPFVEVRDDLPEYGAREDGLVDFKGAVDKSSDFECAKDICAFANASGGVLIIGGAEDSTRGALSKWKPFATDQDVQVVVRRYRNLARDRCRDARGRGTSVGLFGSGRSVHVARLRLRDRGHRGGPWGEAYGLVRMAAE